METATDLLMTAGLIVVVIMAVVVLYLQWQKATPAERVELVETAVRRLVDAAEQLYPDRGAGQTKYGWVMNRLVARFPDVDWDVLSEHVEQAVHHLNAGKAARQASHRNGRYDA